ncbi:DsbA family oxidoreductase [Streptomyces changanensis]|uniref:DsbA family oxidoreductase n=1 Tax=Streptomyces changanensis TaxID=2964669 RepID=A0ABY5NG66_9ACTN|nr:DsbA family oxidoreductase [Streptomyces changanensis]UUS35000.1 DsbA family oxidoreductase [Streptomyces changanensis]
MRVEIWGDVICPWCYIGTARFEKALAGFAHRDQVEVVHRSFELDPAHDKAHIEPVHKMLADKFGPQGPGMDRQVAKTAAGEGLAYRTDRQVGSTLDAHRLLHLAKAHGRQHQLLNLLFDANFAQARTIFTPDALLDLALKAGIDEDEARRVLNDPDAYLDAVRADEQEAARLGATGVPFFVIDRRYALSGGQPAEAFAQALNTAWTERPPTQTAPAGAVCGPDGTCAVPPARP